VTQHHLLRDRPGAESRRADSRHDPGIVLLLPAI